MSETTHEQPQSEEVYDSDYDMGFCIECYKHWSECMCPDDTMNIQVSKPAAVITDDDCDDIPF